MSSPGSLGERLRRLRLAADLTLEGLAERSGLGVRTIGDIERGVSMAPQRRTIEAVAHGLGLDARERDVLLREARARRAIPAEGQRASAVAPHRLPDFSGREREILEILSLLAPSDAGVSPPVVISGLAGVGKTTVALEAVNRACQDDRSVLFLDLDGFSSLPPTPLEVVRGLLRQMPGAGGTAPSSLDEAIPLWRSATAASPAIILLDNAANEGQIRPVLTRDARSTVVVTSRRALAGLEGVRRVRLGPLSAEESVMLLQKLIPADQRAAGDLGELAELADRIPLAMRIAGNRIASRPAVQVADFTARMRSSENRLRLLVAGDLAVETALAVSYDDLEPATSALFRSISVIDVGTFDARLAAATLGLDVAADDVDGRLDELTDLGLVEARGGNRYRVHDLVRLFAATRLEAVDGVDATRVRQQRVRGWLLGTLERAGAWFETGRAADMSASAGAVFPDADSAAAWIRLEEHHWWPAMQAAARAGEHTVVVDVADALHWFSELWRDWGHWLEFFTLAVESARALRDPRLEAMHLGYLVWATMLETRDGAAALRIARDAVAAAETSGDHQQRGWAHFYLGWMLRVNNLDGGLAACREAVVRFDCTDDRDGAAQAVILLGSLLDAAGDNDLAIAEFGRVLEQIGGDGATTPTLVNLITQVDLLQRMSSTYVALDRPREAIEAATRSIVCAQRLGSDTRVAEALCCRANAHLAARNIAEAEADIAMALQGLDTHAEVEYVQSVRERLETLRRHTRRPSIRVT